jgi:uncharacterized membrane protein YfcA
MPILLILSGIVVGVLAAFAGVGGGIVMVPLMLWLGKSHTQAVGTSFLAILIISVASLFFHNKMNNVVYDWGIYLGIGGVLGAFAGAKFNSLVSQAQFQKIFGAFIVLMGLYLILKK